VSIIPADASPSICGEKRANGKPCQSKVKPGSGPCMWHAKTLRHKLRAWAKNKTLSFVISVGSVFVGTVGLATWVYDNLTRPKPAVAQPHRTGNAVTSGSQSPAISGDGNSVTYGQPPADKKNKETKKAKE